METEELSTIGDVHAEATREIEIEIMEDAEPEADESVAEAPTLVEDYSPTEPAPATDDLPETNLVDDKATVVETVSGLVEAEEQAVVDDVDAILVNNKIEAEALNDTEPEAEVALVDDPTPTEDGTPPESTDNTPEPPANKEKLVVTQAVIEPVEAGETSVVEVVDGVVTKEIEAKVAGDAEIEVEVAMDAASAPAEDATLTYPAALADDTTDTPAGEEVPATIEDVTDSVTAEEMVVVDGGGAVLTMEVNAEAVADAVSESEMAVVADKSETARIGERYMRASMTVLFYTYK